MGAEVDDFTEGLWGDLESGRGSVPEASGGGNKGFRF